ncbi:hypothetical protein SGRIM128S_05758 [Streptomyces griseomycini]
MPVVSDGDRPAALRGLRHGVLDDTDEDILDRLALPGVAHQQRYVVVEIERLADVVDRVPGGALEAVDADEERYGAPLEVVDGREAVLQAPGVGEDDRAEGALGELRPT